jgi:hypothetical protein
MSYFDMDELRPAATQGEAHAEWHRNTGVPIGPMGGSCPWDSCGWLRDELADQQEQYELAAAWGEYTEADPEDYAELDALLLWEAADDPPF